MYRGSNIELNALIIELEVQEIPKIRLLLFWVATGNSWLRHSSFLVLCRDRNSVSRHGSQILSHRNCRNMTFLVATGVLVLCRDDVVTEVSLSRLRRSRREVRVATGA